MSQTPRRLLNYTLLREIGRGGMASVWYAENSVGRKFAVKLLKPELVAEESSVAERFRNEAQIMVRLEHPAILRVEDFYEDGPTLAIIMEYLAGHDLNQHVHKWGALPEAQVIGWFGEILDAFDYVHQKGYFHRDVKPSNLFLTDTGAIKVMDFGIAKIVGADLSLTQTDMLMGSPLYMSPEQITSPKGIDFKTDIYSLGVTLHTLLAGKKPYNDAERSMFSIQTDIVQEPLPRLTNVSSATNDAIQRATQKNVADRFNSCREFRQALTAHVTPPVTDDATILQPKRPSAAASQSAQPPVADSETVLIGRVPPVTPAPGRSASQRTPVSTVPPPASTKSPVSTKKSNMPLLLIVLASVVVLSAGFWFYQSQGNVRPDEKGRQVADSSSAAPQSGTATLSVASSERARQIKADVERGIALYKQSRFDSSFALLTRHQEEPAFTGNAEAMTDLGIIYFFGSPESNLPQNLAKAGEWLQKGVDANYPKAYYYLGLLKDGVDFVRVTKARGNSRQIVDLYKASATGGDAYAKMTLGELFLQRNKFVRSEEPCTIKAYLQQAVTGQVPEASVALATLTKQGYCQ